MIVLDTDHLSCLEWESKDPNWHHGFEDRGVMFVPWSIAADAKRR